MSDLLVWSLANLPIGTMIWFSGREVQKMKFVFFLNFQISLARDPKLEQGRVEAYLEPSRISTMELFL